MKNTKKIKQTPTAKALFKKHVARAVRKIKKLRGKKV
jgi:hypothetical protein